MANNLYSGNMPKVPNKESLLLIHNSEIYYYYFERLVNLALSQFKWNNLPPGVDRYYLERTFLYDGKAAIYNPVGTDIWLGTGYIEQPTTYGMYDVYGYPRKICGVPSGGFTKKTMINTEPNSFVIAYDNMTRQSLIPKMQLYAKLMWEVHDAFRANVEHQLNPWIVVAPSTIKTTVENFFNRFLGHQRMIQLTKGLKPEDIKTLDERAEFIGNEMLDCLRRLWSEALNMLGITSEGGKKERYLNDELTMARQEDILSLNSRLLNRREMCDKLNERFGFNVSVEISSNDIRFSPYEPKMEVKRDGELYDSIDDNSEQQAGQTGEFAED